MPSPSAPGCWTCSAGSRPRRRSSWWSTTSTGWTSRRSRRSSSRCAGSSPTPSSSLLAVRDADVPELPESLRRIVTGPSGQRAAVARARRGGPPRPRRGDWGWASSRAAPRNGSAYGTQGSPLYARAVLEEFPPDEWEPADSPLPSPRSFRRLVERRYDACGADTRRLVDAAAVLGPALPPAARGGARRGRRSASQRSTRPPAVTCSSRRPGSCRGPCRSRIPSCARRCTTRSAPHAGRPCTPRPRRWSTTRPSPCAIGWPPRRRGTPTSPATSPGSPSGRPGARRWPSAAAHLVQAARLAPDPGEEQRMLLRRGELAAADRRRRDGRDLRRRDPAASPPARCATACWARWRWRGASRPPRRYFLRHAWERCGPDTEPEVVAAIALQYGDPPVRAARRGGCRRVVSPGARPDRARTRPRGRPPDLPRPSLAYSGRIDEAFAATAGADGDVGDAGFGWLQPRSARGMLRLVDGRPRRRPGRPRGGRGDGPRSSASSTPPRSRSPPCPGPTTSRATGTTPSCTRSARSRSTTSRSSGSRRHGVQHRRAGPRGPRGVGRGGGDPRRPGAPGSRATTSARCSRWR